MFIITTDHASIPNIVEDGVNGIVMSKAENTYKRLLQIDKKQYSDVIEKTHKMCDVLFGKDVHRQNENKL